MQQRITLIALLVVSLALGAYVYFYEIKGEEARTEAKDKEKQLFVFQRDAATAVVVRNKYGSFEFSRATGDWTITNHHDLLAENPAVEDVLFALDALRYTQSISVKGGDLSAYGLATPRMEAEIVTPSGKLSLLVGDETPIGGATYVMKGGDSAVYATTYPLTAKLEKDLEGWRDKRILTLKVADVQGVRIEGVGREPLAVVRGSSLGWTLASPPGYRLDAEFFDTLLYDLEGLSALAFKPAEEAAALGLNPPYRTVTLTFGAEKDPQQLFFGTSDIETRRVAVVRQAGEEVRLVRASVLERLDKPLSELRDRKVVPLEPALVSALSIKVAHGDLSASRTDGEWKLSGSLEAHVAPKELDGILTDLTGLTADALIDEVPPSGLARFGLEQPALEATLTTTGPDGQGTSHQVRLGKSTLDDQEAVFALLDHETSVARVNRFVLEDLLTVLKKKVPEGEKTASSPAPAPK